MKVTLVATVRDARPFIEEFLDSVRGQTRRPDEVLVVDGGSEDGTWEIIEHAEGVQSIREPGANIALGRNLAIRKATHDVIAVTDADCVLSADWLEHILQPIERGADVSAGFYRPITESFLQVCATAWLPDEHELRPGWKPSSRSLAFRREAFEAAGEYPEWLDVGEDMYLNHRLAESGARIELAPMAVVHWRIRPNLAETWRQYAGYAEGDARAAMYTERHLVRFGAYAFGLAALASRRPWLLRLVALGGAAYARRPLARSWRRFPAGSPDRWKALAAVPALMAFVDVAKMWGYLRGLGSGRR
jgi:glycosyltransferase involved in cell wall biosynthesis